MREEGEDEEKVRISIENQGEDAGCRKRQLKLRRKGWGGWLAGRRQFKGEEKGKAMQRGAFKNGFLGFGTKNKFLIFKLVKIVHTISVIELDGQ